MNTIVSAHGTSVGFSQRGVHNLRDWHQLISPRFRHVGVVAILVSVFLWSGCRKTAQQVTITFFDSDFRGVPGDHRMIPDADLQEFTRETGIRVNDLPTPEDNGSKLDLAMNLLRSGAPVA